jgi:iron/zinc/copper transport system substrate-binding protein
MTAFFWRSLILSIIGLGVVALSAACNSEPDGEENRVQVVTTLPLFKDMIANVGGDRVEVTALLPSGSDPHTWEPSPKDVQKVEQADVAFVNGWTWSLQQRRSSRPTLGVGCLSMELAEEGQC